MNPLSLQSALELQNLRLELIGLGLWNPVLEVHFSRAIHFGDTKTFHDILRNRQILARLELAKQAQQIIRQLIPFEPVEKSLTEGIIHIGRTIEGNSVGLEFRDLVRHVSVDGSSGSGKTSLVRHIVKGIVS